MVFPIYEEDATVWQKDMWEMSQGLYVSEGPTTFLTHVYCNSFYYAAVMDAFAFHRDKVFLELKASTTSQSSMY